MEYETLPSSAQLAYSDLLAQLVTAAIPARGISYFTRDVKGRAYWYMQYTIGNAKRSHYLGPDTQDLKDLITQLKQRQAEDEIEQQTRKRLVATGVAAGLHQFTAAEGRVYEVLVQSGLFEAGAVLVGTHAFINIGNLLCVRWPEGMGQTEDIDLAHEQSISVASPYFEEDIKGILAQVDKGVIAVPALNSRDASTKFRLRNRDLTISLLTPELGKPSSGPVLIKGLNAAAEPVRFLDYLLVDTQLAALPVGAGLLVKVPDPARFAVHKLVVSQRRTAAMAAKSRKDLAQAMAILAVLKDLRPGDVVNAIDAAKQMGNKFLKHLKTGAKLMDVKLKSFVLEQI